MNSYGQYLLVPLILEVMNRPHILMASAKSLSLCTREVTTYVTVTSVYSDVFTTCGFFCVTLVVNKVVASKIVTRITYVCVKKVVLAAALVL